MYCPDCGAESFERRNYCKQCGGSMSGSQNTADVAPPFKPNALAWVVGLCTILIGLGGLAAVFTAAYALAQRQEMDEGVPIVLMVFGSVSVVVVVGLLVHLTLNLAGMSRGQSGRPNVIPRRDTTPVQLPAPSPVVASVTEHTTRTFEPAERAPSAKE
jgi:hypothetical protein